MAMQILRRLVCPRCNGKKNLNGDECPSCRGEGKVKTVHMGEAEQGRAPPSSDLRESTTRSARAK